MTPAVILTCALAASTGFPAWTTWHPPAPAQGQILVVEVAPSEAGAAVGATFLGRTLRFRRVAGGLRALAPIPLTTAPGSYPLEVQLANGGKSHTLVHSVFVVDGAHPASEVSVATKFTDKKSSSLRKRISTERSRMGKAVASSRGEALWSGRFVRPTATEITSVFGAKRVYNGELRSRHEGLDLDGLIGDPVLAAQDGVVTLVGNDFFYPGTCVYLDHGHELFTTYLHLSQVNVREGQKVRAGQRIGAVGKSGRVTGPHLHFGVRLLGSYVDPAQLFELDPLAQIHADAVVAACTDVEDAACQ